ncbi:type I-U CRISPR-associated protein Csx17 [Thiohalophilus sp.]|uniref:type I-G CRISPR-associated protein Cas8g1/Csx17 n=1 Tax=Thiohalophilus sp. TaxID=3028392 RepID=UPI002ACDA9B1|nr:type I-U CRISPR-associated protein Csx17 [Thiohalophilus sp.]MDZ7662597.1 type I-U CRISPR-associated protein Csx17 [Thiohalophilus sp.]
MNEIVLSGCTATPLSNYLKAIGLLRILTGADATLRGAWLGEHFVIRTKITSEEICDYLLHQYQPTPILAPWNGGSGFYEKDNKGALQAIQSGHSARLAEYREVLKAVETALEGVNRSESPKNEEKQGLLTRLRGMLPDTVLDWLDAAVMISGDGLKFPPLLGTGGNDGRLDFTNNFMQRIIDIMDVESGAPTSQSGDWLAMSLFAEPAPAMIKSAIGQFSPGQVGGPNSTTGYEDKGRINPWDFVLMIEGALGFAAAVVRRAAEEGPGVLSYPFTVRAVAAGAGNLGVEDADSSRGELWMPLWSAFTTFSEIRTLLSEGRVAVGRRQARDALDFIRAVHQLGAYRGVDRFQRYGLLRRSGKAYIATPLQRVSVRPNAQVEWIDELEQHEWLSRFRRFAQGEQVARRFIMLRKRLEDALFEFAGKHAFPTQVQSLLALLGEIQFALSQSTKAHEANVGPVPLLSARWIMGADDGSSAYRIARALASLHGEQNRPLSLRAQLFPVHPSRYDWIESACNANGSNKDPACRVRLTTPWSGRFVRSLGQLLERRLWLAEQLELDDKPLNASAGVGLDDLHDFLVESDMDQTIAFLLPGFSLISEIPETEKTAGGETLPAAFGLLKLVFTADKKLRGVASLPKDQKVPVPPGLVGLLESGNPAQAQRAVQSAWRRLRGSGLAPAMPLTNCPQLNGIDPRRVAAALLIPLSYGATGKLARTLLELKQSEVAESA